MSRPSYVYSISTTDVLNIKLGDGRTVRDMLKSIATSEAVKHGAIGIDDDVSYEFSLGLNMGDTSVLYGVHVAIYKE